MSVTTDGLDIDETRFKHLLEKLGVPPSFTTLRINTEKVNAQHALSLVTEELEKQYRMKNWPTPNVYFHQQLSDVIIIDNRGPNQQLEQMNKEVIVDYACGMSVLRGADVFVQGIMGAPLSTKSQDKVSVFVDINGKCRRGLCERFNGEKIFVGNGIIQYSRTDIYCSTEKLSGVGIMMTEPLYEAPCLADFLPEIVFSQNLPSIVCSHVLNPQPGETVLDMCAAPGGKTTHIATLMKNKGRVVAIDKTPRKIERIQNNLKAWSIECVETYCFDSTKLCSASSDIKGCPAFPPEYFDKIPSDGLCGVSPWSETVVSFKSCPQFSAETFSKILLDDHCSDFGQKLSFVMESGAEFCSSCVVGTQGCPPYPPETFDKILLDGPCSAFGQRPSCVNKMTLKDLKSYPNLQRKLFQQAVQLIKPGGVLVYSTCTITLDENELMVDWALKTFPSLQLVCQEPHIAKSRINSSNLPSANWLDYVQRFDPSYIGHTGEQSLDYNTDTIGFFIAKFVKR